MTKYQHTFDSADLILATALVGGVWKDVWWPFWLFFVLFTLVAFRDKDEDSTH